MAGRQTIQRFPSGLLDTLGMKGTGDTPHELAGQLAAYFNASEMYLENRRAYVNPVGPGPTDQAYSYNAGGTVPQGQLWIVKCVDWSFVAGAATDMQVRAAYSWPQSTPPFVYGDLLTIPAGVAKTYHNCRTFQTGELILQPGMALGYYTERLVAGGGVVTGLFVDFYRLLI